MSGKMKNRRLCWCGSGWRHKRCHPDIPFDQAAKYSWVQCKYPELSPKSPKEVEAIVADLAKVKGKSDFLHALRPLAAFTAMHPYFVPREENPNVYFRGSQWMTTPPSDLKDISYPSKADAILERLNLPEYPLLYTCSTLGPIPRELRIVDSTPVLLSRWELIRPVTLWQAIIPPSKYSSLYFPPVGRFSNLDVFKALSGPSRHFLWHLGKLLVSDAPDIYEITSLIGHYFVSRSAWLPLAPPVSSGVLYPSIASSLVGVNFAFSPWAADYALRPTAIAWCHTQLLGGKHYGRITMMATHINAANEILWWTLPKPLLIEFGLGAEDYQVDFGKSTHKYAPNERPFPPISELRDATWEEYYLDPADGIGKALAQFSPA